MNSEKNWTNLSDATHYTIFSCENPENGMAALRECFPKGEADELNIVLFSTSGVHGYYTTIEEAAKGETDVDRTVTFLVVQPRRVCLRCGNAIIKTPEDVAFLLKLRESSHRELLKIGK